MGEEITEVRGTLEEMIPEGGMVMLVIRDDAGVIHSLAGDYNPTCQALRDSGLRTGDRLVAYATGWGGLAGFVPEDEE